MEGNMVKYPPSYPLLQHYFPLYLRWEIVAYVYSLTLQVYFYSVSDGVYIVSCACGTPFSCTSVYPRPPYEPCGYLYLSSACYHASYWSLHLCSSLQSVNYNYHLTVQKYQCKPCGVEHLRLQRVLQASEFVWTHFWELAKNIKKYICVTQCAFLYKCHC